MKTKNIQKNKASKANAKAVVKPATPKGTVKVSKYFSLKEIARDKGIPAPALGNLGFTSEELKSLPKRALSVTGLPNGFKLGYLSRKGDSRRSAFKEFYLAKNGSIVNYDNGRNLTVKEVSSLKLEVV